MRNLLLLVLVATLAGCATSPNASQTMPKDTPTGVVFNSSDILYTGGLGEAGVNGFCKRTGSLVAQKFGAIGINAVSNTAPSTGQAKIAVTLLTIETKSGAGFQPFVGAFGVQKVRAKYSAQLESPAGATLATWQHDVDEESVDKLADHIASDIVKYLKKGYR